MTIHDIRELAAELDAATAEPLKKASKAFHECGYRPDEKEWQDAWSQLTFWTDARNGFRQAENALHALEMMANGGEWN